MSKKANMGAALAFVVGVVGAHLYLSRLEREVRGGESEAVLSVTRELVPGQRVESRDLAVLEVPGAYLDTRRVRARDKAQVVGVAVQTPLSAGDSLLWSDLAAGSAGRHLAQLIKPGQRAYSLPKNVNSLGGLVHVGDHVDILLERGGQSEIILERVPVLAIGGRIEAEESKKAAFERAYLGVTVGVSPAQARKLQAAEARGDLRLVLRSPLDRRVTTSFGTARSSSTAVAEGNDATSAGDDDVAP